MSEPKLIFRINETGQGLSCVRQVCLERGWVEYNDKLHSSNSWNMWWRSTRFRHSDYKDIQPWQRVNHFPKSSGITRKDSLARNLRRMRAVHGSSVYNFSPVSFNLPNDYTKFVAEYTRVRQIENSRNLLWICKPAELSRGRGIFLFRELNECQYDYNAVVQRYISNPHLIAGYKFDLRIYVVVPSYNPLTIYIYQDGLVRFSTSKYNLDLPSDVYSHLTNTSLNKNSPAYMDQKDKIGYGCKWSLSVLFNYLKSEHIDTNALWARIVNIVILTVIIQTPQVPTSMNCFELFGFDILIDENLKAWLLEVNFGPSLSLNCEVDMSVKKPLINDIIDLMQFSRNDAFRGSNCDFVKPKDVSRRQVASRTNGASPYVETSKQCYCFVRTNKASQCNEDTHPSHSTSMMDMNDKSLARYRKKCSRIRNKNLILDMSDFNRIQPLPTIQSSKSEYQIRSSYSDDTISDLRMMSETTSIDCDWTDFGAVDICCVCECISQNCTCYEDVRSDEFNANRAVQCKFDEYCHETELFDSKRETTYVSDKSADKLESECYFDCADFQQVVMPNYLQRQIDLLENKIAMDNLAQPVAYAEETKFKTLRKNGNKKRTNRNVDDEGRFKHKADQLDSVQRLSKPSRNNNNSKASPGYYNNRVAIRKKQNGRYGMKLLDIDVAPSCVGKLQLVYPFSEATRTMDQGDIAGIIRETQKWLKSELTQRKFMTTD